MNEYYGNIFAQLLTPEQLLSLLIYGEARGEGRDGKIAVAQVVINRERDNRRRFGKCIGNLGPSIISVILQSMQFSCFNEDDPNYSKLVDIATKYKEELSKNDMLAECLSCARQVLEGKSRDLVDGAQYYFNPDVVRPKWSKNMKMTAKIGKHTFYKE